MKNTMFHLGPEWALYVVHGRSNAAFVRHALAGVTGVKVGGWGRWNARPSWHSGAC